MADRKARKIIRLVCIAVAAIAACPILVHCGRVYGPDIWGNLHVVNFVVAWIPAVLSILVAFVPDKELETRMRATWRVAVIACGIFYSITLWHQQTLTDKSNESAQTALLQAAVAQSNAHADGKFANVQQDVGTLAGQVRDLGQSVDDTRTSLTAEVEKTSTDLGTSISKVGKPDPPVPAKLVFSLWDTAATPETPVLSKTVQADSDGNFPVDITLVNASESTADAIDFWIELCQKCSFAKEPAGFEKPAGIDDRVRHRVIGSLNPGVSLEKTTILVKSQATDGYFQVGFRYSCKTCGGKIVPNQVATILQGTSTALASQ